MKIKSLVLASVVALSMVGGAAAAGYIPLGPKVYTPQPDLVTPNPDLVTPQPDLVTPQPPTITENVVAVQSGSTGAAPSGSEADRGFWNERCQTFAYVNQDCTVLSIADHDRQSSFNRTDLVVTPNPDIVTPQPDLVTPQPPTITPQPPLCTQKGWSLSGGFGNYSC